MLALIISLSLGCFLGLSGAEVIPGRAFDRFISIWLENQVSIISPEDEQQSLSLGAILMLSNLP